MIQLPVIVKSDGSQEVFSPDRLVLSLRRAGAGEYTAQRIAETITSSLVPGASSREVYSRAFALLRKEARPVAARYALRRALLELGPTGHPFEDFIAHLYRAEGWSVETRKIIKGKCVSHEVDIYAKHPTENTFIAAELKYHNDPGAKSDVKVALYAKSRFDDIFSCDPATRECPIDRGLLVTNTKFSSDAIAYAECAGVELLGWNYPQGNDLFIRLTRAGVYPVTTLTELSHAEKKILLDAGITTVRQIASDKRSLDALHLSAQRVGEIRAEVDGLLSLPEVPHDMVSV
jgi:hypothetical protein